MVIRCVCTLLLVVTWCCSCFACVRVGVACLGVRVSIRVLGSCVSFGMRLRWWVIVS